MTKLEIIARSRTALGSEAVAIMAAALRCTPQRFKYPSLTVIAILELIEAALAAGISRDELPPRWHGRVSRKRRDLRSRFASLFAPRLPVRAIRTAIGLTGDVINRRMKASPETRQGAEFLAIAELLEVICAAAGVDAWPTRWRERADAHDGRAWQARAVALLGPAAASRLAYAVNMSPDYICRAFRGERDSNGRLMRPSGALRAVIELLETLDREGVSRDRWPDRWRWRRSSLAAAALGETDTGAAAVLIDDDNAGGFERGANCGERVDGDRAPLCFEVANGGEPDASGGGEFCLR
jgi:hypothetical protein